MRRLLYPLGVATVAFACGTTQVVQQAAPLPTSDAGTPTPTDDDDAPAGDDDDAGGTPAESGFPTHWIDGTKCDSDPAIQTWQHAPGVFILRQSLCTSAEGPFMYLFVGETKAMLVDTGDGGIELRPKVKELLGGKELDLVIAHSHSHGDHVAGDSEFRGKTKTTVVGLQPSAVYTFFKIDKAALTPGSIDLGNRIIDVIPIPGHEAAHVAYFDRASKVLLTGDTLYPGRLYVDDWAAYQKSVPRLLAFVQDGHTPSTILGGHIELRATPTDTPDFVLGSKKHPDEHALPNSLDDLKELDSVVKKQVADHNDDPVREPATNFIFDP